MKLGIKGLAVAAGIFAASSASAVTLNLSAESVDGNNRFLADIAAFFGGIGNVGYGTLESVKIDDGGEELSFQEQAAESGQDNTLTVGANSGTETKNVLAWGDGTISFLQAYAAGFLSDGDWEFSSTNGVFASFGDNEMGVFFDKRGGNDSFILAFDDNNKNQGGFDDDNHDDYVWIVSTDGGDGVNIVPLPASMFLLGGALAGLGFARRRKS